MTETTREREQYFCTLLEQAVSITRTLQITRNARGETDVRDTKKFDCDGVTRCPVGSEPGGRDWRECVHPELRRRG